MAYEGWLLKIGTWTLPFRYIQDETYKVSSNKDTLADWTDYDGNRHVVYSPGAQTEISFSTRDQFRLSDEDVAIISEALSSAKQAGFGANVDAYSVKFYDPGTDTYVTTKKFTLEPVDYVIERVTADHVYYSPTTFTFKEVSQIEL